MEFDIFAPHITRDQLTNLSPEDKMTRACMGLDQEHKAPQKAGKVKKSKGKDTDKTFWNNLDSETSESYSDTLDSQGSGYYESLPSF